MHFSGVKKTLIVALVALAAAAGCSKGADGNTPPTGVTTIPVAFAGGTVTAEIASTTTQRQTGLMNRSAGSLAADAGMLFVFAVDQNPQFSAFYMANTNIPLSIAFIDANYKVVSVDDMAPNTTTLHMASGVFRYALEVNQGWLAAHNVKAGSTATFTVPSGIVISP